MTFISIVSLFCILSSASSSKSVNQTEKALGQFYKSFQKWEQDLKKNFKQAAFYNLSDAEKFLASGSEIEKTKAVASIYNLWIAGELNKISNSNEHKSSDQQKLKRLKAKADHYLIGMSNVIEDWVKRLDQKQISWITQDNKNPLFPLLADVPLGDLECSDGSFNRLVNRFGIEKIAKFGPYLLLAFVFDVPYQPLYLNRAIEMLNKAQNIQSNQKLKSYFEAILMLTIENLEKEKALAQSKISRYVKSNDMSEDEFLAQIHSALEISPECLGSVKTFMKVYKKINVLITTERAKYLLDRAAIYYRKENRLPGHISELLEKKYIDEKHPIFGNARDAWFSDFELRVDNEVIQIRSKGKDRKSSQDDVVLKKKNL